MIKTSARAAPILLVLLVGGCAQLQAAFAPQPPAAGPDAAADPIETVAATLDPTPAPPPPAEANTAEEFDTTSAEDRAAAVAAPEPEAEVEEERLGTTIASLGDPSDPGIWIETGYVSELTPGRVEYAATGASINIELRPSGGDPGAGAEISLPAMRLLEIPFTELPELVVYR